MESNQRTESLEAAFLRFRRAGALDALERVFRETAPDLRQLALHLTRDVEAADDAVQSTFLAAIDDARSFRASARVTPWLVGILHNRVREQRRRAARSASMAGDEVCAGLVDHGSGPDRQAAVRELFAAARRGIGSLAPPYREVVQLTVEGGLLAKEIAERLGRPAGTVRAQVARGMAMLRRTLPASSLGLLVLDVGGAADHGAGARLAAIRARVLEHGAQAAPRLAASASAGASSGGLLAVAGLVVVAFVAVWSWSGSGVSGATGSGLGVGAVAGDGVGVGDAMAPDGQGARPPAAARRRGVGAAEAHDAPSDPPSGRKLIARCVDAETREPLEGVRADLVEFSVGAGEIQVRRVELGRTGADGLLAVELDALPEPSSTGYGGTDGATWRLELDAGTPRAGIAVSLDGGLAAGASDDADGGGAHVLLGDLAFEDGVPFTGRILGAATFVQRTRPRYVELTPAGVDAGATAVRGAFRIERAFPILTELRADGGFDAGACVLPGAWMVAVEQAASPPVRIERAAGSGTRPVSVEIEEFVELPDGPLRGLVVDAAGRAVRHAVVTARGRACPPTRTAADGRFEIARVRPGVRVLQLEVSTGDAGAARSSRTVDLASAGGTPVTVELPVRTRRLRIEFVDEAGVPVEDVAVRMHASPSLHPRRSGPPALAALAVGGQPERFDHEGPFEGGVLEIEAFDVSHRGRLEVVPCSAAARAAFAPTVVELDSGPPHPTELRVVLPRLVGGRVRIVDEEHEPVRGAVVECFRLVGDTADVEVDHVDWSRAAASRGAFVRVGLERTDGDGVVQMQLPDLELTVRVRAPGRGTELFAGVDVAEGDGKSAPVELVLGRATAHVEGRLSGAAFGRWLVAAEVSDHERGWPGHPWSGRSFPAVAAAVVWTPTDVRSPARFEDVPSAPVAADGTFRIGVPAGVRGRLWLRQIGRVARTGSASYAQSALGEVDPVARGDVAEVALDADAHAFGMLRVQVRGAARGGIDPEHARASLGGRWVYDLRVHGGRNAFGIEPSAHLERGRASILVEPPGTVEHLSLQRLRVEERGTGYALFGTGCVDFAPRGPDGAVVRVVPGGIVDVEMPVYWGGLEATVRSVAGEPLAEETLELAAARGVTSWVTTDEHGRLDLPFLSPGRVVVRRYEWTASGERIERSAWAVDVVEGRTVSVEWVLR